MSRRKAQAIAWLTCAGLAASGMGYHLIEPLDTLAVLALVPFVFLAFDIRKALGEKQFRSAFAWFAICLLPNYNSDAVVRDVPPEWRAMVGLLGGGIIFFLVWHFSLHADWSDPHVREKVFAPGRFEKEMQRIVKYRLTQAWTSLPFANKTVLSPVLLPVDCPRGIVEEGAGDIGRSSE